jgi:hypothetical protein
VHPIIFAMLSVVSTAMASVPAGPIGAPTDFRTILPDSIRSALASSGTTLGRHKATVALGPSKVQVRLSFTSFQRGAGKYIVDLQPDLLRRAAYDSIRVDDPVPYVINRGTKAAPLMATTVTIRWFSHTGVGVKRKDSMGSSTVYNAADGASKRL